jgi:hypothetical protein
MSISTLVNIGSFSHLKAFIPKSFQISKYCNSSSDGVNER